jgi:cell division protease FtsH
MRKWLPTLAIWIALVVVFLLVWKVVGSDRNLAQESPTTFQADLEADTVAHVLIDGDRMVVTLDDGVQYETPYRADPAVMGLVRAAGIDVQVGPVEGTSTFDQPWIWVLLVAVVVVVFLVVMVRRSRATGSILSLRKSRARLLPEKTKIRFTDVGGAEEVKQDLRDIIDYLKTPAAWKEAGIRLPHGVLLEGPPGCGKTLLARAVAGEANVPFFFVSASEFVEMFVGVGAARIRDMFETASKKAPCILFIDELDAVGRRRGSGVGSAHDEREQTLNQLLVCMDGFETDDRVVVMAATNRPDVLDKALLRPGRLDRILRIPLPDRDTRLEILEVHTRNKKLASNVSLGAWADRIEGVNGADLENTVNEAALLAMRRARAGGTGALVEAGDFEEAYAKRKRQERLFDQLDQILVESASQLAQPAGKIVVRAVLRDGESVDGELVWADGAFVKLRRSNGDGDVIVPKVQVKKLEALTGTETVAQVTADQWAHGRSELA